MYVKEPFSPIKDFLKAVYNFSIVAETNNQESKYHRLRAG